MRSWTESLLSTPLDANFGLGRRGRREGAQPEGEFALHASRCLLRAWPGGGSGGVRSWTGYLLCTPFATDFGPGPEAAAEGQPTRRAGPAGGAQEEHLLLLRITTTSGLMLDIHLFGFVSVRLWSQKVRRLDDSLLPRRLWRAGRGDAGKRDPRCCFYHPIWQPLGWRLSWKDCCCCWLWLDLLAISRTLCSPAVSGVMLPTVPDFAGKKRRRRKKQAWKEVALHPPLSAGPADPAGAAQEENLLLLLISTASGLMLDIHSFGFVSVYFRSHLSLA